MNLFIDTSNWNLILILEKDNKIIDQFVLKDTKKVSDVFIPNLQEMLKKNNLTIHDITNLYVTTGPGSYTGERVGLTMVKTLKTLNVKYNVYVINSLLYQAGMNKKISLLDARGKKYYLGIYDNAEPQVQEQLISIEDLDKEYLNNEAWSSYQVVKDYQDLDFSANYLALKPKFELIENPELLKPTYLKNFI
ncbi:tRNA (adenosine(37)-N6)-threonylcarbamoyltransferase complex dimerization subunit type 1 TsaB [Mesoplasma lactucae]|uniref:tRNA (Adenosine(37)-N6)-threonylcarbamoyltransferase complex dimerization subunit type 1 TsaB n=1 Tax=Mesoplasma lactucae ATCC 49193 TaxID=81460 RepID=A0A291IS52_9MOLU|nr:tRNA (adenosine(37)-N6)-threonylcarbamoyltransferase complex dimerization subunit type 1 TsaB [Mesoplasma lactucae]ATG97590.1 tRNA (adenosine(37)-N6)-threonylcarbamoyltransferase complex dimerization subunit type 1 TsaB [Mesoplasma lactucae ATCC 49193]ATZ19951.1 tRNA N6-adenosine(37)-N6-threonylcarbamoyltransferase complex dimerization subunit TsaB [Mesoplasma lactucae ATCC 49193]MCL8217098.1 hypothetical protein [Mesoplasma lactucae ATCC 49193]